MGRCYNYSSAYETHSEYGAQRWRKSYFARSGEGEPPHLLQATPLGMGFSKLTMLDSRHRTSPLTDHIVCCDMLILR